MGTTRNLVFCCALALAGCADVPVSAPRELTSVTQADGVQLSWTLGESPGTEQWVERRPARGRFKRVASLPADATTFLDGDAAPGVVYVYRVLSLVDGEPWNGGYSRQVTADARATP
jgi:hypothetical protein